MVNIKLITGSVRPGRFNIQPAEWLFEIAERQDGIAAELIDLDKLNLPFLDEKHSPKTGKYEKPHTKTWASIIEPADGFILVTPEYNHSYSPVLKNALDFLYNEWNYKPVTFVGYGSLAGGSRAIEHLRGIAAELKMYDLRDHLLIPNYWSGLDQEGNYSFSQAQTEQAENMLNQLAFWAEEMKASRKRLAEK